MVDDDEGLAVREEGHVSAPMGVRPPRGHDDEELHWLIAPEGIGAEHDVARWHSDGSTLYPDGWWLFPGDETPYSPQELATSGWRYSKPAWHRSIGHLMSEVRQRVLGEVRVLLQEKNARIAKLEVEIGRLDGILDREFRMQAAASSDGYEPLGVSGGSKPASDEYEMDKAMRELLTGKGVSGGTGAVVPNSSVGEDIVEKVVRSDIGQEPVAHRKPLPPWVGR